MTAPTTCPVSGVYIIVCDVSLLVISPCSRSSMDVSSSLVYFYPRLLALHSLNPEEEGIPDQMR